MKIGILHLTDIHFTVKSNLDNKIEKFVKALINDVRGLSKLYYIISGDIAFSGSSDEYKIADKFISITRQLIIGECPNLKIKYIIIPGNHDCNFNKESDNQLRKNAVLNMNYQTLGNDTSVIDVCLSVQTNFWGFYGQYADIPEQKMFYEIEDSLDGQKIVFHCINTAWMSQIDEKAGTLFFPVSRFYSPKTTDNEFHVAVWHHPYNWFNPNTPENNKKEFEKFTESIASIHFFGHEHEQSYYLVENKNSDKKITLLSGELFNDDKKNGGSGFQTVVIDIRSDTGKLKKYSWNGDFYASGYSKEISLLREIEKSLKIKDDFFKTLDEIKIPIVIDNKKNVKLSDLFVYPDLDITSSESKNFDNYINSKKVLEKDFGSCVIDGENQIGKSSLLSILFINFYENDYTPLWLTGAEIKNPDLEVNIKKSFQSQYSSSALEFDKFVQLDKGKKVLLIDDFHDCGLNYNTSKALFEKATEFFGKVVIMVDSANSILPSMRSEFKSIKFYSIKTLGYKKRNEIIEKYHYLKENPHTVNEQTLLNEIKVSFDSVQAILGDKLMPSYPIYILSILQALEYKPLKQNETSFGYCYQTLIHFSLHKAGVSNSDIDSYFNFLSELAYYFVASDVEYVSNDDLFSFYSDYRNKFIIQPYDGVISTLKKSKIIIESDNNIKFGYNYILYYLSAKRISDFLHVQEGKDIVNKLFRNLQFEKNANILVFITHHSKDISFIEDSILNSMYILDNINPITLDKKDIFYNEIAEFIEKLKNDIIDTNRKPRQEREKLLEDNDARDRVNSIKNKDELANGLAEANEIITPFHIAFRSIEIVGQIIKNRKGSLMIPQLKEMVSTLYTTGFRTVGYMSNLLNSERKNIIDAIAEETDKHDNIYEIELRVNEFIQMVNLKACLTVFTKLTQSIGHKDLKSIYSQVAKEINTPAAKLVSFSINSYYGSITPEEVKTLADEFKGNIVALQLLKARVISYVYNKNPDFKIKQKFASTLGLQLAPHGGRRDRQ